MTYLKNKNHKKNLAMSLKVINEENFEKYMKRNPLLKNPQVKMSARMQECLFHDNYLKILWKNPLLSLPCAALYSVEYQTLTSGYWQRSVSFRHFSWRRTFLSRFWAVGTYHFPRSCASCFVDKFSQVVEVVVYCFSLFCLFSFWQYSSAFLPRFFQKLLGGIAGFDRNSFKNLPQLFLWIPKLLNYPKHI